MRVVVLVAGVVVATAGAASASLNSAQTSGEVFRISLHGSRIDLSRSPADDIFPVVSPDGRRVVFASDRGGAGLHLYVVGTDGRGLERVSSRLDTDQSLLGQVAWAPDSKRLAVALPGGLLFVVDAGARRRLVATNPPILSAPTWSPDGRMIAYDVGTSGDPGTEIVSSTGKRSWRVRGRRMGSGQLNGWGWSATGRLAVIAARRAATIGVFDESGRLQMSFPGRSYAWSADGSRLASITSDRLEVRALSGRLLFRKSVPRLHRNQHNGLIWADGKRVMIGGIDTLSDRTISVDTISGRIATGNNRYFGTVSPNRQFVAGVVTSGGGATLRVSRLDGSDARTLARRVPCRDLVETDLAWLPDSRSLVYDLKCRSRP